MLLVCCVCGRVKDGRGWRNATPEETEMLKDQPGASHGYCTVCADELRQKIDEWEDEA